MTQSLYGIFSVWGELEDIAISQKGLRSGSRAYMKFQHRYYAEFAREAMSDQMDVFEGQKEPLAIKWGSEGTGNPFDLTEAEKAAVEVAEIKA